MSPWSKIDRRAAVKSRRPRRTGRRLALPALERFEDRLLLSVGFRTPVSYDVGPSPWRLVQGDFNGDSNLDLATLNTPGVNGPTSISILLGNGDGTFDAGATITPNVDAGALIAADLNGDGKLDLATANSIYVGLGDYAGTVSVHLGKGDGTFGPLTNYTVEGGPLELAAADLNGDGKLDLVTTHSVSDVAALSVLLGKGDGTYGPATYFKFAGNYSADPLLVADVTGDGKLDVITGDSSRAGDTQLIVAAGDGNGGFTGLTLYPVDGTISQIAAGDLNGDGALDVVVSDRNYDYVRVLLGQGDGTLEGPVDYKIPPAGEVPDALLVTDLDGDGVLDVVTANSASNSVALLIGRGDGTLGPATFFTIASPAPNFAQPYALVAGDYNGDGKLDLAVPNTFNDATGYKVYVLLQNNPPAHVTAGGPYAIKEGQGVTLTASATDPDGDALTYLWDLDGDGQFDDRTGAQTALSWADLQALGLGDDGTYTVSVLVSDVYGSQVKATAGLTVANTPPTSSVTGPASGVRGQELTFTLGATDPSAVDAAAGFTFNINWGDGSTQVVVPGQPLAVGHTFSSKGTYNIQVTATDKDGGVSAVTPRTVTVKALELQTDPGDPSKTALVVGGTTGDDVIRFAPVGKSGGISVLINRVSQGVFFPTGHIVAYGQAGDDDIKVAGAIALPSVLFGGAGADLLIGGGGSAVLLGGDGDDQLLGGRGRNVLIGGEGADRLEGGASDDILIAGTTAHDASIAELVAASAAWDKSKGNIASFFNEATVYDDGAADVLTGGSGRDWFFLNPERWIDTAHDAEASEYITITTKRRPD